jgi:putative cell wall-binding protein
MRYDLTVDSDGDGIPNHKDSNRPSPDPALTLFASGAQDQRHPSAGLRGIVWADGTVVRFLDYGTDAVTTLDAATGVSRPMPDTAGDQVVWVAMRSGSKDIAVLDLLTGVRGWLGRSDAPDDYPSTDGSAVAWISGSSTAQRVNYAVPGGAVRTVTPSTSRQSEPVCHGGVIAWTDDSGGSVTPDVAYMHLPVSSPLTVERLAGSDRYATAVAISQDTYTTGCGTPVVLATGLGFPDALSAAGLAGVLGGPVLLSQPTVVPAVVMTELKRLDAGLVILVGGETALGAGVARDLVDAGFTVDRIWGADRYETAARVADEMRRRDPTSCGVALIARGDSFPDALALSPIAYRLRAPILLSMPNQLGASSALALKRLKISDALIAGGTAAVPTSVEGELAALAVSTTRVAGVNRYDTAVRIAQYATSAGWLGSSTVGIAQGTGFADALSGGAWCGNRSATLLLSPPNVLAPDTQDALRQARSSISQLTIFGGIAALDDSVRASAVATITDR